MSTRIRTKHHVKDGQGATRCGLTEDALGPVAWTLFVRETWTWDGVPKCERCKVCDGTSKTRGTPSPAPELVITERSSGGAAVICRVRLDESVAAAMVSEARSSGRRISELVSEILAARFAAQEPTEAVASMTREQEAAAVLAAFQGSRRWLTADLLARRSGVPIVRAREALAVLLGHRKVESNGERKERRWRVAA